MTAMPDEFPRALGAMLREHLIGVVGGDAPADEFDCCADAVLAMPEMQAIHSNLVVLSIDMAGRWGTTKEGALRRLALPESVVWWVLTPADSCTTGDAS